MERLRRRAFGSCAVGLALYVSIAGCGGLTERHDGPSPPSGAAAEGADAGKGSGSMRAGTETADRNMRPAAEAGSDNAIPHPPVECITIGCPDVLVLEATLPDAISTAGVPMTIECCHANHCEKAELSNGPSPLVDDVGWSIRFGDNPWAQIVLSGTNNRITVAFWGNPLDSFNPGDRYSFELFASDGTVIVRDERIVDYEVVEIGCNHCQHAVPRE